MKKFLQVILALLLVVTSITASFGQEVTIQNGEATFKLRGGETMTFDNLPAGVNYKVTEDQLPGWTLTSKTGDVGKIQPNKTSVATFINKYSPNTVSVTIEGKKLLDGKPEGSFKFELLENGEVIDLVESQGGVFSFSPIVYKSEGQHTYTVREVDNLDPEIVYDTHTENVTVNVINENSTLKAQVTYDQDGLVFNNERKTGSIKVYKKVVGHDTKENFKFELWDGDKKIDTFTLKGGEYRTITGLDTKKTYKIKEVDIPKCYVSYVYGKKIPEIKTKYEYHYQHPGPSAITIPQRLFNKLKNIIIGQPEEIPELPWDHPDNISYYVYQFDPNILDYYRKNPAETDIKPKADTTTNVTFVNVFQCGGEVNITLNKELLGSDLKDGDFQFELVMVPANSYRLQRLQIKSNNKDGSIVFDPIKIADLPGFLDNFTGNDNSSVTLYVQEVRPENAKIETKASYNYGDWSFSNFEWKTNSDNFNGKMTFDGQRKAITIEKTIVDGKPKYTVNHIDQSKEIPSPDPNKPWLIEFETVKDDLTFHNKYQGQKLKFKKEVVGTTKEDTFQFVMKVYNENGEEVDMKTEVEHLGKKSIIETNKVFDVDDKGDYIIQSIPENYTVEIAEKEKPGYTIDKESSVFKGQVRADNIPELKIVNKYFQSKSVTFTARKKLHGANLKDYSFEYYLLNEEGSIIDRAVNDQDGIIKFSPITYDQNDIGKEFNYQIVEVNNKIDNIVYDTKIYKMKVEVKDSEKGMVLKQTTDINPIENPDGQMVFNNYYIDLPLTGKGGILLGLVTGSLIITISLYYWRKRRKGGENDD